MNDVDEEGFVILRRNLSLYSYFFGHSDAIILLFRPKGGICSSPAARQVTADSSTATPFRNDKDVCVRRRKTYKTGSNLPFIHRLTRMHPTLLQIMLAIIHRRLHPRQPRTKRGRSRRLFGYRLLTPRSLPQQLPRLPIPFILRFAACRAQRNRLQPPNLLRRNDVPHIFQYDIRRQKIERPSPVAL